ncbi:UNVERIFIED_CONTAM: Auxin transporter-like protein 5 [Sesamum angustifolium]|uniref:Auxin transporter-like protein 5 n=1 Tax=Sesamum angustifolium TaxID=2727405 RepID=A0AAW2NXJ9_9LAMI
MAAAAGAGSDKVVETVIVGNYVEMESEGKPRDIKSKVSNLFWHGGSAYDAWFSCASNQLFYGLMGVGRPTSLAYSMWSTEPEKKERKLISGTMSFSNIYYINDNLDKRTWTYIFGACCATTVFIPSFHNYRIWSFLGLLMTTYTAWYLTIASLLHGQVEDVKHSGPTKFVLYFTGATNILYTFGGHAVTVDLTFTNIHDNDMIPPSDLAISLFCFPCIVQERDHARDVEATKVQGNILTGHALCVDADTSICSRSLLGFWRFAPQPLQCIFPPPKIPFRDMAVILMLIHQFITFGFACTPLYFVWEKAIGMHECKSLCKRAAARLPVVVPIWFLAIIFPFFGPINSTVGSLLVSFTVYIIPALAYIFTFRSAAARENAVEQPPKYFGRWVGAYVINIFVVVWVLIVGFGFGGWASVTNFIHQIDTFGLFTKCYQCPPPPSPPHLAANATAPLPSPPPRFHHP